MDFEAVTDKTCWLTGLGEGERVEKGIQVSAWNRDRVLQALCCEKSGLPQSLCLLWILRGWGGLAFVSCHLSGFSTSLHILVPCLCSFRLFSFPCISSSLNSSLSFVEYHLKPFFHIFCPFIVSVSDRRLNLALKLRILECYQELWTYGIFHPICSSLDYPLWT